jgi:dipeptidase D
MTPHNEAAIRGLNPASVWQIFAGLASVPRPSKNEAAIQKHVIEWARGHGFEVTHEPVGNVIIRVPASQGREKAPIVVLQGHLDMVAEANRGTNHDFDRDPIRLVQDKDAKTGAAIVRADNTTLGADNGMGVALAMAAAIEPDLTHGPLELLFTCDEEAGMTGAKAITPKSFAGRTLINLDSEEDDAMYIGCAGGADVSLTWDLPRIPRPAALQTGTVIVRGLTGGHSGCDIHLNRGNAIKLLTRALLGAGSDELQIASIRGGSKRNAIPREAEAVLAAPAAIWERLADSAARLQAQTRAAGEPKCEIVIERGAGGDAHVTWGADTRRLLSCLQGLPSGVLQLVPEIPGLVQTSNNVSTIECTESGEALRVTVGCLARSSSMPDLMNTVRQVAAIGRLAGATIDEGDSYPGWQPNPASPLLATCRGVYAKVFGHEPHVRAIHAGLECGIIGEAVGGGMDMISFGPTIMGAHSPDERVFVESVGKIWALLKAVLGELGGK